MFHAARNTFTQAELTKPHTCSHTRAEARIRRSGGIEDYILISSSVCAQVAECGAIRARVFVCVRVFGYECECECECVCYTGVRSAPGPPGERALRSSLAVLIVFRRASVQRARLFSVL